LNTTTQIVNTTPGIIYLPPSEDFPAGFKLVPGDQNNVPNSYVALESVQKALKHLEQPVVVRSYENPAGVYKSQVIVFSEGQAGPEHNITPTSLDGYPVQAAKELIRAEGDRGTLQMWLKNTRDREVKSAITDHLKAVK
jgi:hypothetical protein